MLEKNKKILLHACCATCSGHVLHILKEDGWNVTVFFYNPNIHPQEEYKVRMNELKEYCIKNKVSFIEAGYDTKRWFELTKGMESESEGGARCEVCYRMRLEKTAREAKENGFNAFASTLTISPHKKADVVNRLGKELAREYQIDFLEADWKKQNGFKCACEIAKKEDFYRQNYCGCSYSLLERKRKGKIGQGS